MSREDMPEQPETYEVIYQRVDTEVQQTLGVLAQDAEFTWSGATKNGAARGVVGLDDGVFFVTYDNPSETQSWLAVPDSDTYDVYTITGYDDNEQPITRPVETDDVSGSLSELRRFAGVIGGCQRDRHGETSLRSAPPSWYS